MLDSEDETIDIEGYNSNDFEDLSINNKNWGSSPKLYALLNGTDEYDRVRKLRGCLKDLEAVENYLRLETDIPVD